MIPTAIGPMMPARMILAETYSEIQRKVKKEIKIKISTTCRCVSEGYLDSDNADGKPEGECILPGS